MTGKSPISEQRLRQLRFLADRAGPIDQPLRLLSDQELDAPIDAEIQPPPPAEEDPSSETPAPPDVPGYQLDSLLDVGGQAAVYRSIHEPTGRAVALKIFHGGRYLTAEARRRLDREVKALAALRHPAIVTVLDRGRTADGSFYLATDLIDGQSLDQHVVGLRASQDYRAIIRLFIHIADAVQAIHDAGLVHRDLKPANVLIAEGGRPYLIDFGLARYFNPAGDDLSLASLTGAGQILGTLPWASPEQADGGSARLDARSDIYSFALMLYDALAGQSPYRVRGTISEVLNNIRKATPAPIARSHVALIGLDLQSVDRVLARALAKKPDDRYPSITAMKLDLERLLAGQDVERPVRSRRLYRWWSLALAVPLLAAGVYAVWPTERDIVVVPLKMPTHTSPSGMRFVLLRGGDFQMGSLSEEEGREKDERRHAETIERPFWIATTEVTRGQYRRIMGGQTEAAADDQLPITGITQEQATEFCQRLSELEGRTYRLPDEAEWELACRAGSPGPYAGTMRLDSMGWYVGNSDGRLQPVGGKSPNPWGLYDMHGNAREWCRDGYTPGYERQVDRMDRYQPVVRGGSFRTPAEACRSASRECVSEIAHADDLGFRIVMEANSDD